MADPKYTGMVPQGDKAIGIRFSIPHGKGLRYDTVRVPIADVLRAADAYRGCVCESNHYPGDDGRRAGHATWHVDNRDMPIPCLGAEQRSPATDLAGHVRNYLGACDRIAEFDARAASDKGPYIGHEHDREIHVGIRDRALAEMRKAAE